MIYTHCHVGAVGPLNLYKFFRDRFEARLDQPFLLSTGGSRHSYGDIDRLSAGFAAALVEAGVNSGDRVVVQVDKSPGAVALYLACLRIGAVYVPLNTAYTAAEVSYFLGDAAPVLFVCRPGSAAQLSRVADQAGGATTLTLGDSLDGSFADLAQKLPTFNELTSLDPGDVTEANHIVVGTSLDHYPGKIIGGDEGTPQADGKTPGG